MRNQLLVDVSTIARRDAGTGIQRVVRAVAKQLLDAPPPASEVRLVRAGRWRGYRYADAYAASLLGRKPQSASAARVAAAPGDAFLALDLAAQTLPRHRRQLDGWKQAGVRMHFVVYDLLPALHPEWFTTRGVRNYAAWIRTLAALADSAICTSATVSQQLREWLDRQGDAPGPGVEVRRFRLGADIDASAPSVGATPPIQRQLAGLRGRTTILVVGTLEPRKAHAEVLAAFEALWREGREVNLVFAGRQGWGLRDLAAALRRHPEQGRRFHWLEGPSDEVLCALYALADGILMASRAEGFGLPMVEAALHGKPILARDVPIFREIAGAHAEFFTDRPAEVPAPELGRWIDRVRSGAATSSRGLSCPTWRESTQQLVQALRLA